MTPKSHQLAPNDLNISPYTTKIPSHIGSKLPMSPRSLGRIAFRIQYGDRDA